MSRDDVSFGGTSGVPPVEANSVKPSENLGADSVMAGGESGIRSDGLIPGRPLTNREEYNRVMFLARLVLGFTILAAVTLSIVAISTGRDLVSIGVGALLVVAAGVYYAWTARSVKRDLAANPRPDSND